VNLVFFVAIMNPWQNPLDAVYVNSFAVLAFFAVNWIPMQNQYNVVNV
jgi:hypothetical protein